MYIYNAIDQSIVDARVRQFADQTERYLSGRISEDEFKPLRLQNGVYVERHSPLLRVAIPYGLLSSRQLRMLAQIGRKYDRGFGHFTTRQNIQFNWVKLEQVHEILADLASVQMHAIQTSGSCIRNVTTDHLAGVAHDERVDPRPLAELMRQWSTLNPEFAFLPRKFKVAYNGAVEDRAASEVHDLAFDVYRDEYHGAASGDQDEARHRLADPRFNAWVKRNVSKHKRDAYGAVTISLKPLGIAPGDATSDQMDAIADLADRFSFGQIRVSHHQNLVLADVARSELWTLYQALETIGLSEPNVGLATDIICCPGGDYCALANAKSIPVAAAVQETLAAKAQDIGTLAIKMSGCINACGHHHVGHIGILGVDKKDEEWYQILIGGRTDTKTALGQIVGKAIPREAVAPTIERLTDFYLENRSSGELFIDAVERLGKAAFHDAAFQTETTQTSPSPKIQEANS